MRWTLRVALAAAATVIAATAFGASLEVQRSPSLSGTAAPRTLLAQNLYIGKQQRAPGSASMYGNESSEEHHHGGSDYTPNAAIGLLPALIPQLTRQRQQPSPQPAVVRLPRPGLRVIGGTGPVKAVVYAPDGRFIYTLHGDDAIRVWDTAEGGVVQTWQPHRAYSDTLAIAPDGRRIASGEAGGLVLVLAAATGQPVLTLPAHRGAVRDLAFDPSGALLATVGDDGFVRVWNTETGEQTFAQQASRGAALAVAWTADGRFLITGGADGALRQWSLDAGTAADLIRTIGPATALATMPNGGALAIGTGTGHVLLWDFARRQVVLDLAGHAAAVDALAFTPDSATLVSVGTDRLGHAWATANGQELRRFIGHVNTINDVAVAPNGFLVTAGEDGTARLWTPAAERELAQMIATNAGWAVLNPLGQFDSADGRFNDLQWLAVNRVFGLDNLSEAYYEPGMLALLLAGAPINTRGLPPIVDAFTVPPRVRITKPERDDATDDEKIKVEIEAVDAGAGIGEVRLYQNERRLAPSKIKDRDDDDDNGIQSRKVKFETRLVPGANVFRATAFTPNGVESEPVSVTVTYEDKKDKAPPGKLHVLAIGIDQYANPALNLNYGVSDARAVGELVDGSATAAAGAAETGRLFDRDASRESIRKAFKSLADTAPQDAVVVYYAGHGLQVGDEWYLVPADVDQGTEETVLKKGISAAELLDLVMQINAQKVLLVLDACQSGGAVSTFAKFGAKRALRTLSRQLGVHLLAATEQNQLAVEFSSLGHGAFTYTMLQGARGPADRSADGRLAVSELVTYTRTELPRLLTELDLPQQTPLAFSWGNDFDILAVNN